MNIFFFVCFWAFFLVCTNETDGKEGRKMEEKKRSLQIVSDPEKSPKL